MMNELPPIGKPSHLARLAAKRAANAYAPPSGGVSRGDDSVELSNKAKVAADLAAKLNEVPDVRMDKIEAARAAIAGGDYETDEKIDKVVDAIAQELFG